MSTVTEIESAVQKLTLPQVRELQAWIGDYLRQSEAPLEAAIADTWEKLGPAPEIDYDKL